MHIVVEKKILAKSLGRLHSIVERRNTIPVLSNVKLETDEGRLQLSVTDTDLYAIDSVSSNITEQGSITVPVYTLFEIVRKLPDTALISMQYDQNDITSGVRVTSDAMECVLPAISTDEFPNFIGSEYTSTFSMKSKIFRNLLVRTRYAIQNEETRYYLNGVYIHAIGEVIKAAATDVHRLANIETPMVEGAEKMPGIIIPRKTVNEIVKILENDDADVSISVSSTKILIKADNLQFASKLVDGKFPHYNKAIPQASTQLLEIDLQALLRAIDLVTTVSADKIRYVQLHVTNSKVTLSVSSNMHGTSKATQEIEASYNGEPVDISFNAKYLTDALSTLDGPIAHISISAHNGPILIQDGVDKSGLHILMPMQA